MDFISIGGSLILISRQPTKKKIAVRSMAAAVTSQRSRAATTANKVINFNDISKHA